MADPITAQDMCLAMGDMTARELKVLAGRIEIARKSSDGKLVTDDVLLSCVDVAEKDEEAEAKS